MPRSVSPPTTPICRHRRSIEARRILGAARDDRLAAALAEPGDSVVRELHARSDAREERRLGERDREAALGGVVRAREEGAERARKRTKAASATSFGSAGRPAGPPRNRAWYSEPSRRSSGEPGDVHEVAFAPGRRDGTHVLHRAHTADDRRRVDRAPVRLVVEGDVAGDDGDAEGLARLRHSLDRLGELPGDLRLLRVPEVEAVRDRERRAACAGDVSSGLENGERTAGARVERGEPAGSVQRDARARERLAAGGARRRRARAGEPCAIRPGGRTGGKWAAGWRRSGSGGDPAGRPRRDRDGGVSTGGSSGRGRRLDPVARSVVGQEAGRESRRRARRSKKARSSPEPVTASDHGALELPAAGKWPRQRRAARAGRRRPCAPGSPRS